MTDALHALRCVGFAGLRRLADVAGRPESELEPELLDLAAAGLVTMEPGPFGGWGLTEAGRIEDARRTTAELAAAQLPAGQGGARVVVAGAYERFLELNPLLLDLCSAWQLRPVGSMPDDHRDRVLGRFVELDRRVGDVCVELASVLPRFGRYRVRLAVALEQARSGMLEQLTDSTSSYHAVWFQLHEDLLVTLGIARW